jgi:predicted TIM-barrel fold metal-dependent hydrolase
LIDPHFHYWDIREGSHAKTGQRADFLGDVGKKFPTYLPQDYAKDLKQLKGFKLRKAVFVEVISDKPKEEAMWVINLAKDPAVKDVIHGIVAYAQMENDNVEELLKEYAKYPAIKGIRQIINHHPQNPNLCWPKIKEDYLLNSAWKRNYALLAKYNLSFDFQLNPHQMKNAAELISQHPKTIAIVDHMGTLHLGSNKSEEDHAISAWREGIRLLSRLPNVYVKLSMLEFTKPGWLKDKSKKKLIGDLVKETIKVFGANRCMFASNWPVDAFPDNTAQELYDAFAEIAKDYTDKEKHDLFYGTANRAYRLDDKEKSKL